MPYKKKAPAKRTKKAVGGALSAAQKRLLGSAQAGAVKTGQEAITKQMVDYTRKYGDQRKAAAAPAKRKAPTQQRGGIAMSKTARQTLAQRAAAKRRSQSKARAGLGRDQKRLLSEAQKFAIKRGKGTKAINNYTKKYGLTKAAKQAAMNKLRKRVGLKPRTTTSRPAVMPKRGTAAYNQLMARRRAAAAKRRAPSRRRAPTRMTPAQRRARLLAARRRMAAMRRRAPSRRRAPTRRVPTTRTTRRAPTRRPNTRSQNLAARRSAAARRRSRAGVSRRIGAPTSRRGRPSTATRQRRMFGGMIKRMVRRTNTNPMRAKLTGVKRKAATGSPMINRFKKRGILGKTRTAIGKKRAVGTKVSKSAYKGRGLFGSLKRQAKRTSGVRRGIFGRMFGGTMRPASGGMRRVGGKLTMGKAMTAPKRMAKSPVSPRIIKVPKTKYGVKTGADPYAKAMNKAMKM